MKINTLKEIIKKKENKNEFAIITNLKTGESEIYETGKTLSEALEKYSDEIKNFYNLIKVYFPNITVYPCLGNHDTYPLDQLAPPSILSDFVMNTINPLISAESKVHC